MPARVKADRPLRDAAPRSPPCEEQPSPQSAVLHAVVAGDDRPDAVLHADTLAAMLGTRTLCFSHSAPYDSRGTDSEITNLGSEPVLEIGQAFNVSPATDEDGAIATMTMAFSADPVARWVWRGAHQYLTFFPPFVKAFAGAAFGKGTADVVDDYCAVAMWLPPGVGSADEEIDAVIAESIPVAEQDDVNALFEQMGEFHPTEDHWYLPLIGVDFASQSRGHGSGLLRHALERCDADGLPAYLEATTPRNRALYARHAFEDLGVIQAAGSPPMWPMLRRPHGA